MKFNIFNKVNKGNDKSESEDAIATLVGDIGKWQLKIFISVSLVKLSSGWVQLMILFLTPKLNFWCVNFENDTKIVENMTCYEDCLQYEYDVRPFDNTIVSEWDLICGRQWLASFTQTVLQFGILIGSVVFGFLSDRFGRRYTFLASISLLILTGFLVPFSSNYTLFTTIRLFLGFATAGTMVISFVIVIETIGPKYRELMGCLYQIPFILGHMSIPLFAYFLRNWRDYTLGLAIPPIMYLGYFFVIKESPRWLLSVGKVEEADVVITNAAKMNGLPTENIKETLKKIATEITLNKSEQPKVNYIDLIRTSELRLRTVVCSMAWLIAGFSFFGVNQYISQSSPNPFISVVAAAVIQIPANFLAIWFTKKFGRKITLISSLSLGGICILILGTVPNIFWVTLTLGTLGVSFIAIVCTSIYIYTSELFPTVVRNMGFGLTSMSMRIGSMIAPFVSNLSLSIPWLPTVIFGLSPIAIALLCLLLPETKGRKLPDRIEDVEKSDFVSK